MPDSLLLPLAALLAVALDTLLGEPRRFHPLVGFGHLATALDRWRNGAAGRGNHFTGSLAWALLVLPLPLATWATIDLLPPVMALLAHALLLAFALGGRSLSEHALAIAAPLVAGDLVEARDQLRRIVSRDTQALDAPGIARATVESVLENGNDAVFGALFWFTLLGGPGALAYRLANTLDAMWGYRTQRLRRFGWAAARADDALNWPVARLTALTYALLGHTRRALVCWRRQAPAWDSPNAGPVMAAGAGALGVQLGGPAVYHGQWESRADLGEGKAPTAADIPRALQLVHHGVALWLALYLGAALLQVVTSHA